MAKKYIDTEELIQTLEASCMPIHEKGISGNLGDNKSIADVINNQSVADVEPVKCGRWIKIQYYALCSLCRHEVNWLSNDFLSPYCPNCGARMDGDSNGN